MDLFTVVDQVIELLRSRGRVSYRALRVQFNLNDEALEALRAELIEVHEIAVDQAGTMLVWTGDGGGLPEPLPLLGGFFACQSLGPHLLKGVTQPLEIYRVRYERMACGRLEAAGHTGLTPLVGREQEVALLRERWVQVKDGSGHVVLLSTQVTVTRLPRRQAAELTNRVAHGKALPMEAEVYGNLRQEDLGLTMLAEAMAVVANTGGNCYEAELHRLEGNLLLSQSASHSIDDEACL